MPEKLQYICYEEKDFKPDALVTIQRADQLIRSFNARGYILTLRQLYYQFVVKNWIVNEEKSYKKLGKLVTDARTAGLLPWNGIEDRAREFHDVWTQESPKLAVAYAPQFFKLDFWARQDHYVECWVEKEAQGGIIERPCKALRVPHMSCKGYLSASQAWAAGVRFKEAADSGRQGILIHLGDHDPSGIDMTRDNADRLRLFSEDSGVIVRRIALNMDQVEEYNPPPNPAKVTDSRSTGYIAKFGDSSWELDALDPETVDQLIRDEIENYIDRDRWEQAELEENEVVNKLSSLSTTNWEKVRKIADL